MKFAYSIVVFLLSLLPATAFADDEPVILVLGDSLSAAYNMEISDAWPSLLQDRLDEHGHTYRVFNSSITGETTQGGVTRLPRLLQEYQPAIVLIELGGNDGLRGIPLEVSRANLSSMIDASRAAGAQVILSEMRIPPNYGKTYTERFNAMFHELAEQASVNLLPFLLQDVALEPGMMQADGIHPTEAAQPIILDEVWNVLQPMLQ